MIENKGDIVIYKTQDGLTKINVKFEDETVWLTQAQLVELYQTSKSNISEHIKHIFEEGELSQESTVRNFRTVQIEGNREVSREQVYYNLDMIISLGYRVKSIVATQFRRWATELIKEYLKKGYALDDNRLKELGGGDYWKELLERIRDIRSSEKVMYRQVLGFSFLKFGLSNKFCHAEFISVSTLYLVKRSRIEFGMTLWLILIEQPFFIDYPQSKLQQMCSNFFGAHAC